MKESMYRRSGSPIGLTVVFWSLQQLDLHVHLPSLHLPMMPSIGTHALLLRYAQWQ